MSANKLPFAGQVLIPGAALVRFYDAAVSVAPAKPSQVLSEDGCDC